MLSKRAFTFEDVCDFDEVFFCHGVIVVCFVVEVKRLFAQVFCDLGRGRNLQTARVEQAHFPVIVSVSLVALVTDDAIDCCAAHPELAFLWCLFHSKRMAEGLILSTGFFIFLRFSFARPTAQSDGI